MGIPILGEIEKLINEHGSAVILKERIALANDKYSALELKVAILEKENAAQKEEIKSLQEQITVLQSEKEHLKLQNTKLTIQVQTLNETISGHKIPLDSEKVSILKSLFNAESIAVKDIATMLNLSLQFVNFHLEELQKMRMVKPLKIWRKKVEKLAYGSITKPYAVLGYAIEQEGRKYLIDTESV